MNGFYHVVENLYQDTEDQVATATQLTQFRSSHGIFRRPVAKAAASTVPAWLNFGASMSELQELLCEFLVKQQARVMQNGIGACLVSYRMTDIAV